MRADAPAALGCRAEVWEVGSGGREADAPEVCEDTRFGLDAVEGRGGRPNERRGVGVAISGSRLPRVYLLPGPIVWAHWIGWTLPFLAFRTTYLTQGNV